MSYSESKYGLISFSLCTAFTRILGIFFPTLTTLFHSVYSPPHPNHALVLWAYGFHLDLLHTLKSVGVSPSYGSGASILRWPGLRTRRAARHLTGVDFDSELISSKSSPHKNPWPRDDGSSTGQENREGPSASLCFAVYKSIVDFFAWSFSLPRMVTV